MFQIIFNKVTLSKPNRYLILVAIHQQNLRTEVCPHWTSSPEFAPLELPTLENITLKVCEATSDRKLRIVGSGEVKKQSLSGDPFFQGDVKIEQLFEGTRICLGICNIRIQKKIQFEEISPLSNNLAASGFDRPEGGINSAILEDDGDEQLEDEREQEEDEQIRLEFHCGFNFYLGAAFSMAVRWGRASFQTKAIKDKINPLWFQNTCLTGSSKTEIQIQVCDERKNVLESFKVGLDALRVMFPYHIRLRFKQEFMGAIPEVYFTILRESFPLFSIMEIPIRFSLRGLAEENRQAFVMLSLSKEPKLPTFIQVDKANIGSMQKVNDFIKGRGDAEEDRIELVRLPSQGEVKNISIFKSYMNRKLYLYVFWASDISKAFLQSNWASCKVIEVKHDFEAILRKVYYHAETFTFKRYFEIFNPSQELSLPQHEQSMAEQWKLLSSNYVLRNELVGSSAAHIDELRSAIEAKGKELVQLKKVLKEVKVVHTALAEKEKLNNVVRSKKARINAKEVSTSEVIAALISKQAELQNQKRINAELTLRMDSLTEVEENQGDLDFQLVKNAEELLVQQQQIKKMNFMQKGISRQREVIRELEKVFEQREIDRGINQALQSQSQKLRLLRQKKSQGLNKVYGMLKEHGKEGQSLHARIKRAEQTLIGLNEKYARLIGM